MDSKASGKVYWITHVKLLTLVSKIEDSPISLAQFFGNSWPAEGRPRPKVPFLGGAYMLPRFLRIATKSETQYREGYILPKILQRATQNET